MYLTRTKKFYLNKLESRPDLDAEHETDPKNKMKIKQKHNLCFNEIMQKLYLIINLILNAFFVLRNICFLYVHLYTKSLLSNGEYFWYCYTREGFRENFSKESDPNYRPRIRKIWKPCAVSTPRPRCHRNRAISPFF